MKKIMIIGDAGRGKSTMAKRLSEKLNIPTYCTDDFYYDVKFTSIRKREESLADISKVYKEEKWIVEGTTQWLLAPGLNSADIILYLRYRNIFSQWFNIIRRYFMRKDDDLKKTLYLLRHVFYKRYGLSYKKGKPTHLEVLEPYKDKVVILSSFKEIDKFLCSIN